MNFIGLLFLLVTHFISGRGFVELFKLDLKPILKFSFSMICGVLISSFLPFIMELFHIEITAITVAVFIGITTALFAIPLVRNFKNIKLPDFKSIKLPAIYELPFIIFLGIIFFISIWRCYYYPCNVRDMLSGPEVMAELAVKEKHIINSLFRVDLQSTNNYLKPPYITCLQIIYKLYVQPTGQIWVTVMFLSFITAMISLLREKLHPIIMYFVLLYFFNMPEVFAYTYLMLFDYSNMILFFGGFYFIARHLENKRVNDFAFAVAMFAFATYVRSETLILVAMVAPLLIFYYWKEKLPLRKIAIRIAALGAASFVVYFLCLNIFVKHYIPIHYGVGDDINKNLGDVGYFFTRLTEMSTKLIFDQVGIYHYGYFIYLFVIIFVIDAILFRKYSTEAITAIYGIAVVYVGLAFIGYLLPLADLQHTTKRGLFKMMPLILLYFRNSGALLWLTDKINNWEYGLSGNNKPPTPKVAPTPRPVPAQAAPAVVGAKKKK
jgi:hypothetical protein